jgi:integrase
VSIFKRPNSPFYYTEFIIKGRRVVRSTGTASAREAEAYEKRLKEQTTRDAPKQNTLTPSLTLDQACGKYWKEHGRKLADERNVRRWLQYIVLHGVKDLSLRELSTKHCADMVTAMEGADIGRIAINRTVTCLQGVHNMAAKKWEEPVKVIDWRLLKTKERGRTRSLTRADANRLLAALPAHIRSLVLFILSTGLRKKEAFDLVWTRVNFENGSINVRVKGGDDREVLLTPEAIAVLRETPQSGRYVFDTKNWRKHFEAALVASEIENFRWHDLRHTFATWMGQSGAALEIIRDQLGHSSIAVTQKYRHVVQKEVRSALGRMPALARQDASQSAPDAKTDAAIPNTEPQH